MNILVTINDRYVKYLFVMLTSLFENNEENITIYCLYKELAINNRKTLEEFVEQNHSLIYFIFVDESIYIDFPTTQELSVECYFILMAHELLPKDMDKILYLDSDIIVNGKLNDFYTTSFEDNYMVVCGNTYKMLEGKYYRAGSRPEKGQCFNTGVLLINLSKFRERITIKTYVEAAKTVGYKFELADQGILNILFWDKVKYENTLKYNFRISIYEKYINEEKHDLLYEPVVYHYVWHDNYKIGQGYKPWDLLLDREDLEKLSKLGIIKRIYGDELEFEMNDKMQNLWWKYAQKTIYYLQFEKRMKRNKEVLLKNLYSLYQSKARSNFQKKKIIDKIYTFEECSESELQYCTYYDIEKFIDTLSPNEAIQTMKNLFKTNIFRLKRKKRIKVAFVVYSSSEWQCEELYRAMEKDERFVPVIYICGYAHGREQQTFNAFSNTCEFFLDSKNNYHVDFGGCRKEMLYRNKIDEYDILFYFNSFNSLWPEQNNIGRRKINQLIVHIPYGIYLVSKTDVHYNDDYYNRILFKCCWIYFSESILHKMEAKSLQRLEAYNVLVSGFPKCDVILENRIKIRPTLWKNVRQETVKIIWAPHFNMEIGMNGTFYENYQWFFQYAKEHTEISWIVRPHPRMESGVLDKGVFKDPEDYKTYLQQWDNLPNARVIQYGDYFDIFATSDAMILDSLSFVSEYQYTGKPLLFLKPESPRLMGDYGEKLFAHLYTSRGNDFKRISEFISMLLRCEDPMKNERKVFFDKYLNYKKLNGVSASKFILDTIKSELESEI